MSKAQKYTVIFIVAVLSLIVGGRILKSDSTGIEKNESVSELPAESPEKMETVWSVECKGLTFSLGDTRKVIHKKIEDVDPLEISETEDHIKLYDCLCLHMDKDDRCAAISFIKFPGAQTMEGIHIGSSLEEMIACYGESCEKTDYPKENYEVYQYDHDDYVMKLGVMSEIEYVDEEDRKPVVQNIEIYDPEKYTPYHYETPVEHTAADWGIEYKGIRLFLKDQKDNIIQKALENEIKIKETEEYVSLDDAVCLYFDKNEGCVRISVLMNDLPKTIHGIGKLDYLDDVINCYGDSYERLVYVHKGIYKVYRYRDEESILEFGFHGTLAGNPTQLSNLEIYHKSVDPIYDYGELLEEY